MNELGGLDVLGSPKADNMFHAGWAWGTSTPLKATKLVAGFFGGTRTPMAVSWPKAIKPDKTPRPQFHHVNDIVPTIYDVSASSRPSAWTASARIRWTASASNTASPPRPRPAGRRSNISRSWAAGPSIATSGSHRFSARAFLGCPASTPHSDSGRRTTTTGSSTTCAPTTRKRATWPRKQPQRLKADEEGVRRRRQSEQGLSDRRRPLVGGVQARRRAAQSGDLVPLYAGRCRRSRSRRHRRSARSAIS